MLALTLVSTSALAGDLASAVRRVIPKGLTATVSRSANPRGLVVTGRAKTHEDVSEFMRGIASIVTTPKGFGRVTERHDDHLRVTLFAGGREEQLPISALSTASTCEGLRTEQRRGSVFFTFRLDAEPRNSTVY